MSAAEPSHTPAWTDLLAQRHRSAVPRGRLAPSPTGELHLGNAQSALVAWLSIRRAGGTLVWRTEDLDTPRVDPGCAQRCADDLEWLGLDWDEGPDRGGPCGPYKQSRRLPYYESALEELSRRGRLFPCQLSRRDLAGLASAPHGGADDSERVYTPDLRPYLLPDPCWYRTGEGPDANLRFLCEPGTQTWLDLLHGPGRDDASRRCGDFVLRRRDGLVAYQLAVVVDDALMGITEVVRGADLQDSVSRQLQLWQALGATPPVFAHLPLLRSTHGAKLSKREASLGLGELRRAGVQPGRLLGWLGWSLGLLPHPHASSTAELLECFDWKNVSHQDRVVDPGLVAAELSRVS